MSEKTTDGAKIGPQTPGYLRRELDSGKRIHEIILGLVTADGKAISEYANQYWMGRADGKEVKPLDTKILDRYGIESAKSPDSFWGNEMTLVGGFNKAVELYAILVKADSWRSEQKSIFSSENELRLLSILSGHLNPSRGNQHRIPQSTQKPTEEEMTTLQEIKKSLEDDPSGVSWLRQKANQELMTNVWGLSGADKAISGIERLYKQLTAVKLEYH